MLLVMDGKSAGAPASILLRQLGRLFPVGRNVSETTEKKGVVTLKYHAQVSHSMATNRHPALSLSLLFAPLTLNRV